MEITATKVRDLDGFTGHAALYKLSEPVECGWGDEGQPPTDHVVVSATVVSGPETYIFPANRDGEVVHWGKMDGPSRGVLSHEEALRNAGFKVV